MLFTIFNSDGHDIGVTGHDIAPDADPIRPQQGGEVTPPAQGGEITPQRRGAFGDLDQDEADVVVVNDPPIDEAELSLAIAKVLDKAIPDDRPPWNRLVPKGYSIPENLLRGLPDHEIAILLKHGFQPVKSIASVDTYSRIRKWGVEDLFRPIEETLCPQMCITQQLLDEITARSEGVLDEELQ